MITEYPKIYSVLYEDFRKVDHGMVDIEEKLDGSQMSFMFDGLKLHVYSKGSHISPDKKNSFTVAVDALYKIQHTLTHNWIYRGEHLRSARHNVLAYDRAPRHLVVIFDIQDETGRFLTYQEKHQECERIGFEVTPILYTGILAPGIIPGLLERTSMLGGQKIEGVVVKPHSRQAIGKYVSEAFKEIKEHQNNRPRVPRQEIIDHIANQLSTEGRFHKALSHLRDQDRITGTKRDIGPLLKEATRDILAECEPLIKDQLFKWAWPQIHKLALQPLPDWYSKLLETPQVEDVAE